MTQVGKLCTHPVGSDFSSRIGYSSFFNQDMAMKITGLVLGIIVLLLAGFSAYVVAAGVSTTIRPCRPGAKQ